MIEEVAKLDRYLAADYVLELDDDHPCWVTLVKDRDGALKAPNFRVPRQLWNRLRKACSPSTHPKVGHLFFYPDLPPFHPHP